MMTKCENCGTNLAVGGDEEQCWKCGAVWKKEIKEVFPNEKIKDDR